MELKILKDNLLNEYSFPEMHFPKYTTQLINLANQTAQATRPNRVGQLSEMFPEFRKNTKSPSVEAWELWYRERYPDAIDNASERIFSQIKNLQNAISLIDINMVRTWVNDLVINKTYQGLYFQQVILEFLAGVLCAPWRLSDPTEEAQGIDGYVGTIPLSIKPASYKSMDRLPEDIPYSMIYYRLNNSGDLLIDVEDGLL